MGPTPDVPDFPDQLLDFPAYSLALLGAVEEERHRRAAERECITGLRDAGLIR